MIRSLLLSPKFMPTVLIVLDVGAAVRYSFEHHAGRVLYWAAAAVLTYSVTYMMGPQ